MADPVDRLRRIAAETAQRRQAPSPRRVPVLRSRALQRAALRLAARQRAWNVYIANLRGPGTRLHLAGVPLLEIFPLAPIMGNLTLGVCALSYAGQFTVMPVGDHAACPDLDVFAAALGTELAALTSA